MAVAAEHPAFRYRVVRVLSELRNLRFMTLVAERRLVSLEKVIRLLDGGENLFLNQISIASDDIRTVTFWMDLVACDARDARS